LLFWTIVDHNLFFGHYLLLTIIVDHYLLLTIIVDHYLLWTIIYCGPLFIVDHYLLLTIIFFDHNLFIVDHYLFFTIIYFSKQQRGSFGRRRPTATVSCSTGTRKPCRGGGTGWPRVVCNDGVLGWGHGT
jgi:hypothetical protein